MFFCCGADTLHVHTGCTCVANYCRLGSSQTFTCNKNRKSFLPTGGDKARLLIATDAGVIEADLDSGEMEYVDIVNSRESTGEWAEDCEL